MLQALQPGFGWGGDLRVGRRLKARSAASVGVDMVVERASGDLTRHRRDRDASASASRTFASASPPTTASGTSPPRAAGATLGVVSARRPRARRRSATWPAADDADRRRRASCASTTSAPGGPGSRPAGASAAELHASASFGGRFGAPQYTGHVEGAGVTVRNFIEGVNVTDGTVAIALRGTSAHIETFTAKGGDGTLKLEGERQLRRGADGAAAASRSIASSCSAASTVASSPPATRRCGSTRATLGVDGDFKVDEGLVDFTRSDAPTLGGDVEVVRRPGAPAPRRGARAGAGAGDPSRRCAPRRAQVRARPSRRHGRASCACAAAASMPGCAASCA